MSIKILHIGSALAKCRSGDSTSSSSSSSSDGQQKELHKLEKGLTIREELEMRAAADELKQVLRRDTDGEYHFCYRVGKFINTNISAEQCKCEIEAQNKDKRSTLHKQLSLKRLNSQSPSIISDDDDVEARRPDSPLGRHVSTLKDIEKERGCTRKHKRRSRKAKINE